MLCLLFICCFLWNTFNANGKKVTFIFHPQMDTKRMQIKRCGTYSSQITSFQAKIITHPIRISWLMDQVSIISAQPLDQLTCYCTFVIDFFPFLITLSQTLKWLSRVKRTERESKWINVTQQVDSLVVYNFKSLAHLQGEREKVLEKKLFPPEKRPLRVNVTLVILSNCSWRRVNVTLQMWPSDTCLLASEFAAKVTSGTGYSSVHFLFFLLSPLTQQFISLFTRPLICLQ